MDVRADRRELQQRICPAERPLEEVWRTLAHELGPRRPPAQLVQRRCKRGASGD